MNSLSKSHCDDSFESNHKIRRPKKVLLKCGNVGSVTLPALTPAGTTFTVSSLTLNLSKFDDPTIKFEFSSNIITTGALESLNFQIFKRCPNTTTPVPVGPVWNFSRAVAITDANTFSFHVCDCNLCPEECCVYTVVVTVVGLATVGILTIANATLSALVVDDNQCC